jgi:hypothetical protein
MTLAARQIFLDELRQCPSPFDVIVVDEAHHLAERGSRTKRLALLGRSFARVRGRGVPSPHRYPARWEDGEFPLAPATTRPAR